MVFPKPKGFELYEAYNELEKLVKETKWYEIIWRNRLKNTLATLRYIAAIKGFEAGIVDLEECGVLKRIKNK